MAEDKGEKILSQDEVDTLLNAVKDGDVEVEKNAGSGSGLKKYDFNEQSKLVRAKLPGLKIIYDRFQRAYRQTLASLVRKVVVVEAHSIEMYRYNEWVSSLPTPSCLSVFRLSPLIGQAILGFEPEFVYTLIDNIFGGGKVGSPKPSKGDYTMIEMRLIQKLCQYFTNDLSKAWASIYELNFEFVRTETNPEYMTIVAPSDVVVVTDFVVSFEEVTSKMQFIVPLFALDPIKQLLSDRTFVEQSQPNPNWRIWLGESMIGAKVKLKVKLGATEIFLRDILSLKRGDTIQLDQYVSEPLALSMEGVPKFKVRMGVSCGQKAVQIQSAIERKSEAESVE